MANGGTAGGRGVVWCGVVCRLAGRLACWCGRGGPRLWCAVGVWLWRGLRVCLRPCALFDSREMGIYRGTSLIRNCPPVGPYRRPMPRVLGGSWVGGRCLMGEAPL